MKLTKGKRKDYIAKTDDFKRIRFDREEAANLYSARWTTCLHKGFIDAENDKSLHGKSLHRIFHPHDRDSK